MFFKFNFKPDLRLEGLLKNNVPISGVVYTCDEFNCNREWQAFTQIRNRSLVFMKNDVLVSKGGQVFVINNRLNNLFVYSYPLKTKDL